MSFWFQRIIASMSGVSTLSMLAMSLKVHRPKGRSVSKNLCASVGTTPPSTFVYGMLCWPKALLVMTEVTALYAHVICSL